MRFQFDHFTLDTESFELTCNGEAVHVEPLVFDLLCYFVQRQGALITRDAMVEAVWQGRIVSDTTVSSCIKSLRKVLGDSGNTQHYVRTVRGRGFQFIAEVRSQDEVDAVPPEPSATHSRKRSSWNFPDCIGCRLSPADHRSNFVE